MAEVRPGVREKPGGTRAALLLCVLGVMTWANHASAQSVRPTAAAGSFYPGSAGALRDAVKESLALARPLVPDECRDSRPACIVVPHAGYAYSGETAAYAYKLLEGRAPPARVVLIGPSHYVRMVSACSVADFSAYKTPLGEVSVDTEARDKLLECKVFRKTQVVHAREHCLEVQIPFLQVIWPDTPKIVPIVTGSLTPSECRAAAAQLTKLMGPDTLVIISTDFTHYGPRFRYTPFEDTKGEQLLEKIKELDLEGVRHIESMDATAFRRYLARKRPTICGREAVSMMLEAFAGADTCRPVFLRWANSADVTRDYANCVSYVAMAVYATAATFDELAQHAARAAEAAALLTEEPPDLTDNDRATLLALARQAVEAAVRDGDPDAAGDLELNAAVLSEQLCCPRGVFVTLTKAGQLRGCIGRLMSEDPLYRSVAQVAAMAATKDPRFSPLKASELADVHVEVTVLGRMVKAGGADDVRVGRDGLLIQRGTKSGVLLPQVASGAGWTPVQFLENTCRKAGLATDAWKQPGTSVFRFGATVLEESQPASS